MKRFLLIFLLFLNSIPIFCTDQLDLILSEEIKHLEDRGGKPLVVSLTGFYFEDKQLGSSFSRYLEEKLSKTLANSAEFELFAKEKLEEILATIEISLTDLFESETAVRVGHLKGIQALIGGRYFDEGDRIRIFLDLINLETGTVTRKREFIIQKRFVPPTISLLPDNYTNALYVLNQLTDVVSAEKGELYVKVWITRGNGSTFRAGEELLINFFSTRDCYIKVYHVDVHKQIQLIFPNQYYPNNFIKKEKIYKIPDSRYPFKFVLGPPFGTEFIKVVASTLQFRDIEESFSDLGEASRDFISRGMTVQQRKEQVTESLLNYTIIE